MWVRLRQRLGQGIHLVRQLLSLRRCDQVVAGEPGLEASVGAEQGLERSELALDVRHESAALCALAGGDVLDVAEGNLGSLHVAVEVIEVGVGPPVLLAGDLADGDLIQQRDGAVADVGQRHGEVVRVDQVGQLLHVLDESVRELLALFRGRWGPVEQS